MASSVRRRLRNLRQKLFRHSLSKSDSICGTHGAWRRRLGIESLESRQLLAVYQVTNGADSGVGSLRWAIEEANAVLGADSIQFNIGGGGLQTISLLTPLAPITEAVTIDATTQPGFVGSPIIELNGENAGAAANGLSINADHSTVRGLIINRFAIDAIQIDGGDDNTIVGNWLGFHSTGATASGAGRFGVYVINGALRNTIGGASPEDRNMIGGFDDGIVVSGPTVVDTIIQGNWIGINSTGLVTVPNDYGIADYGTGTVIGGLTATPGEGAGNVISGNTNADLYIAAATNVQGNIVGLGADGVTAISGAAGIGVNGVGNGAMIGGPNPQARNVIGDRLAAFYLGVVDGWTIQNNYIGMDVTGALLRTNYTSYLYGPTHLNILDNAWANSAWYTILGFGSDWTLQGNKFGTNAAGTAPLSAGATSSLVVFNSSNLDIGGSLPGQGNQFATSLNLQIVSGGNMLGNTFGLDAAGTGLLAGTNSAISLYRSRDFNIGDGTVGGRNIMAASNGGGYSLIDINGFESDNNFVRGNWFGVNATGTAALGNQSYAVFMQGAADSTIGGPSDGDRNVFGQASTHAIYINGIGYNTLANGSDLFDGGLVWFKGEGDTNTSHVPSQNGTAYGSVGYGPGVVASTQSLLFDRNNPGYVRSDWIVYRATAAYFTTEGWINPTSLPLLSDEYTIASQESVDSPNAMLFLTRDADGVKLALRYNTSTGTQTIYSAVTNIAAGAFRHVGVTADGTTARFYLDGIEHSTAVIVGSPTLQGATSTQDALFVGGGTGLTNRTFDGRIDEVAVYARALTAAEITRIYSFGGTTHGGNWTRNITIENNYVGLLPDGTTLGSIGADGINVRGSERNTIRGNTVAASTLAGVRLSREFTTDTVVAGNFLGTNVSSATGLGSNVGISITDGAYDNTIGGTTSGDGNLISGNSLAGIEISGAINNLIAGNRIGTNDVGTVSVANGVGILIAGSGSNGNRIGGPTASDRNVISGNTGYGVSISGALNGGNTIQGNYIGTTVSGTEVLGNGDGVSIQDAANSIRDNVISASTSGAGHGIYLSGTVAGTIIAGNIIGLDPTGTQDFGNAGSGVLINSTNGVTIGGTAVSDRNIISGNTGTGIWITGTGALNNTIQGNFIGTDSSGSSMIGNANGVFLSTGASNNTIGGISASTRNVISGNTYGGVVTDFGTNNNSVVGNYFVNNGTGIHVLDSSSSNVISDNDVQGSNADNILIEAAGNVLARNQSSEMGGSPIQLNPASLSPGIVTVTQVVGGTNAIVLGEVHAAPSTTYTIELFSSPTVGQASRYVASGTVFTDTSGFSNFSISPPTGSLNGYVHATLTGLKIGQSVPNTSPLSNGVLGTPAIILGLRSQSPEGTPITLTAFASTNPVTGYLWEVRKDGLPYVFELRTDGTQSDGGIQFTPDDEGLYTVSLRVTLSDGSQTLLGPFGIQVYNVAPTPSFTYSPSLITAGAPVTLASNNSDPGQFDVLKNAWEVRYGSTTGPIVYSAPMSAVTSANFTPSSGGFYYTTMTVEDGDGGIRSLTRELVVDGLPASATIVVPDTTVLEGQTVRARAPEAELNRTEQLRFDWTVTKTPAVGPTSNYPFTQPSRGIVEFLPDDDGVYAITLTISDGFGSVNAGTQLVHVGNVVPRTQILGGSSLATIGSPIHLNSSISDPGLADTYEYTWTVTHNGAPFGPPSTSANHTWTPTLPGTYVVQSIVTDDDGGVATTQRSFTVVSALAAVSIVAPTGPYIENTLYSFTANASSAIGDFRWRARNSIGYEVASGSSPSFQWNPQQGGEYWIELSATMVDGRVGVASYPLVVQGTAPIITSMSIITPTTSPIYEGTSVTVRATAIDSRESIGLSYYWELKKPNEANFTTLNGVDGSPSDFRFMPEDNGDYHVRVHITDSQNLTVIQSITVPIVNVAPTVRIDAIYDSSTTNDLTFLAIANDLGLADRPTLTYQWSANGGTYSTASLSNTFSTASSILTRLSVKVTDKDGQSVETSFAMVQGQSGNVNDSIAIHSDTNAKINGNPFSIGPSDQILVLGLDGNDGVTIASGLNRKVTVIGGAGDDIINAASATSPVLLNGGIGNDTLSGGIVDDILIAGTGTNFLYGGDGNNRFIGGGDDTMVGGADADYYEVHFSDVVLVDTNGVDTIDFAAAPQGIKLNLSSITGAVQNVFAGSTLSLTGSFEKLLGSDHNDDFSTSTSFAEIDGGLGDDILNATNASGIMLSGGLGNDTIVLSAVTGTVDGGDGNDSITGSLATGVTTYIATGTGDDYVNIDGASTISNVSIALGDGANVLTATKISGTIYGNNGEAGTLDTFGSASTVDNSLNATLSSSTDIDIFGSAYGETLITLDSSTNIDIFGSAAPIGYGLDITIDSSTNIDIFGSAAGQDVVEVTGGGDIDIFGSASSASSGLEATLISTTDIDIFGSASTEDTIVEIFNSTHIDIFGSASPDVGNLEATITSSIDVDIFGSAAGQDVIDVTGGGDIDIFGSADTDGANLMVTIQSTIDVDIFGSAAGNDVIEVVASGDIDIFGSANPEGGNLDVTLVSSNDIDIFGSAAGNDVIEVINGGDIDIFGSAHPDGGNLDATLTSSTDIDIFGSAAGNDVIDVIGGGDVDIYGIQSGFVRFNGVTNGVVSTDVFGSASHGIVAVEVTNSLDIDIFGSASMDGPSLEATITSSSDIDIFGSASPGEIIILMSHDIDIFGSASTGTEITIDSSSDIDIYGAYGDKVTLINATRTRVEGGVFGSAAEQGLEVTVLDSSTDIGIFGTPIDDKVTIGASQRVGLNLGAGDDVIEVNGAQQLVAISDDGLDRFTVHSGFDMLIYLGEGDDQAEILGGQLIRVIGEAGTDQFHIAGGSRLMVDGGDGSDQLIVTGSDGLLARGDTGNDQVDVYGGSGISVTGGIGNDRLRVIGSLGGGLQSGLVYAVLDGQDGDDVLDVRPLRSVVDRGLASVSSFDWPNLDAPSWIALPAWITLPTETTYASSIAIVGGLGSNTIWLEGARRLYGIGGDDADTITLQSGGNSEVAGGKGADQITINADGSDNRVFGDQGDDVIYAYAGTRLGVFGEEGSDTVGFFGGQGGFARGGVGQDTLDIFEGTRIVLAGETDEDSLTIHGGTSGVAAGGIGNDTLETAGGLYGLLLGQSGDDHLITSGGTQSIVSGGDGDDRIDASNRGDDLYGDDGDDRYTVLTSASSNPLLRLRELLYVDPSDFEPEARGSDTIDLSAFSVGSTLNLGITGLFNSQTDGLQTVIAGQLQLILLGSVENIVGTEGNDQLIGNDESNLLMGRGGNDTINGMAGEDLLEGGTGDDILDGGSGDDLYRFETAVGVPLGFDTIYEAVNGGVDGLDFGGMPMGLGTLDLTSATSQSLSSGLISVMLQQSSTNASIGDIEEVIGTAFSDTILGNALDNRFEPKEGNDIVDGRGGSDIYIFAGRNLGSDLILDASAGSGRDTLDFVGFDAPVNIDLSLTTMQSLGELSLTLSAGDSIENVLGSSFDDTIIGNARDNALFGGAGADRLEGRAGNDRLVADLPAVVLLDFDSAYNMARGDYNYSVAERNLIQQRLEITYAAFHWTFTQSETQAQSLSSDMGRNIVRLSFSKGRGGGILGDAGEVDFRNIRRRVITEVNINPLLPAIRSMLQEELGLAGYTAQQYSDMVVAFTATIAGHELAHTAGLRHGDSFGPIGSGYFGGTDLSNLYPADPRPVNGYETGWHMLASPASTGTLLADAAKTTFFGEREAIKMAFNEIGRSRRETESSIGSNDTWMLAEPMFDTGVLPNLYVPNLAPTTGFARSGQSFEVSAMAVLGDLADSGIVGVSDRDFFSFNAQAGDYINIELMTSSIRPVRGTPFDGEIRLFNASGVEIAFNDDDFEGTKDATILDFLVSSSGTIYVSVGLSAQPVFGTGGRYELLVSRFRTGTVSNVVGDTLVGGAGNDTIAGGAGDDVILGTGSSSGEIDTLDGKGGYDTVDGQGLAYNFNVNGAPIENIISTVNTPPTVSIHGPADGLMNAAQTFVFIATDPDAMDASGPFVFTISWGDGTQSVVTSSIGQNTISVTKTFTDVSANGTFTISASVKDSRSSLGPISTKSYASVGWKIMPDPANVGKSVLVIVGSQNSDTIRIKDRCGDFLKVRIHEIEDNVRVRGIVSGDADRILVFALGGDDRVTIDDDIDTNVEVWGGLGDDDVKGGGGHDILLGGAGNDKLYGGDGRDLIIGGTGADRLYGDAHDDILVAGFTAFDEEFNALAPSMFAASTRLAFHVQRQALEAILAEWTSNRSYSTRRNNILGTGSGIRRNGGYFLKATGPTVTSNTVFDDGARDRLWGDAGTDWFFANLDGDNQSARDETRDASNNESCIDTDRWW